MQITPSQNVNSTNFKAVNLVKVKKAAFENPENFNACSKLFQEKMGDKKASFFHNLLATFGLGKRFFRTMIWNPDMPYNMTQQAMQKNNIPYSVSWFAQKTGLPIKPKEDSDYLSYYVLTKENKDKIISLFKGLRSKCRAAVREGNQIFPVEGKSFEKAMQEILPLRKTYTSAKLGLESEKMLNEAIGDTPVKTFEISSLDELPNIVKDFDI